MPLLINLLLLDKRNLTLQGDLPAEDLDLAAVDELIHVPASLQYDLEAQLLDDAILVHGSLRLDLECECVRCLKRFPHPLDLPDWACHLPLAGEDKATVVDDCVDLTPQIREDILLAFPQHPLCNSQCSGLTGAREHRAKATGGEAKPDSAASAWAALDKLKL